MDRCENGLKHDVYSVVGRKPAFNILFLVFSMLLKYVSVQGS